MNLTRFDEVATMSSNEIAKLAGKKHKHVLVDIEKLITFYTNKYPTEIAAALVKSGAYKDSTGRSKRCFHLSKDAILDLITGYGIELRAKVIDRWMELEAMQPKVFPKDYISALEAFLKTQKEKAKLNPC